jgi:hypothetical protein
MNYDYSYNNCAALARNAINYIFNFETLRRVRAAMRIIKLICRTS